MARIRTIKPEFWSSEQIVSCSLLARLLFIGLWNFSDDNGAHPVSYVRIKAEVFPVDNFTIDEIESCIAELIRNKLIVEYAVDDNHYWLVTGWKKHQRIDRPNVRHPLPISSPNQQVLDDDSSNTRRIIEDTSAINQRRVDEHSPPEGKGMEGRGKEIDNIVTSPTSAAEEPVFAGTQKSSSDNEFEIFDHWKTIMQYPRANFDKNRRKKIREALDLGYSVDDLKQAIEGCHKTPFNMGDNDRRQRYDAIDLIFRDAAHIDRFLANAINPPHSSKSSESAVDLSIGAI